MTLGCHARNNDSSFLHAELLKGGASIFAVSENDDEAIVRCMLAAPRPSMSYGIDLDNDAELRHA